MSDGNSSKRIRVWVQHMADRPHLMLQWHDPVAGKRKSKSAETSGGGGVGRDGADSLDCPARRDGPAQRATTRARPITVVRLWGATTTVDLRTQYLDSTGSRENSATPGEPSWTRHCRPDRAERP